MSLIIYSSPAPPQDLEIIQPEDSEVKIKELFPNCPALNNDILNLCLNPLNTSKKKTLRQINKNWNKLFKNDLERLKSEKVKKIYYSVFGSEKVLPQLKSILFKMAESPEMTPMELIREFGKIHRDYVVLNRIRIALKEYPAWLPPPIGQGNFPSENEFARIRTLDLSHCHLGSLPDLVLKCKNLTELNLSGNRMYSFANLKKLTNLKKLYLMNNEMLNLPDELWELTKLETLYISDNRIKSISEKIASLKNLKYIRIDENPIESLPQIMKDMNIHIFDNGLLPKKLFPEKKDQQKGDDQQTETCTIQ